MTVSVGSLGATSSSATSTTLAHTTITTPVAVGDVVVVVTGRGAGASATGVADSAGNTYTALAASQASGSINIRVFVAIATAAMAIGGTITATFGGSSGTKFVVAGVASGLPSATNEGTAQVTGSGNPMSQTIPAVGPDVSVQFSFLGIDGAGVITTDADLTSLITRSQSSLQVRLAYRILSTPTATANDPSNATAAQPFLLGYVNFSTPNVAGGGTGGMLTMMVG